MVPDDKRFNFEWLMKAMRWLVPHRCVSCRCWMLFVAYLDCEACDERTWQRFTLAKKNGHTTSVDVEPK